MTETIFRLTKKMKKVEAYLVTLTYCIDNEWNKYFINNRFFLSQDNKLLIPVTTVRRKSEVS